MDNTALLDIPFNYAKLTDSHQRDDGRQWFLVHWRDTYLVNGKICYNFPEKPREKKTRKGKDQKMKSDEEEDDEEEDDEEEDDEEEDDEEEDDEEAEGDDEKGYEAEYDDEEFTHDSVTDANGLYVVRPTDRVQRYVWPPCWLPESAIYKHKGRAKMLENALTRSVFD
jgi:hypothetical protein